MSVRDPDPILEALFCAVHGRIWERRKSGSRLKSLFNIGIDGYCASCVKDFLDANILPLKWVSYNDKGEPVEIPRHYSGYQAYSGKVEQEAKNGS